MQRSQDTAGMDYTSQDIAGMEHKRSYVIAGMDYSKTCHSWHGVCKLGNSWHGPYMPGHSWHGTILGQVIAGMEYVNQVIANCNQAIRQLLSAQLSQSGVRDRRTNNFTIAGSQMRRCHLIGYDNTKLPGHSWHGLEYMPGHPWHGLQEPGHART